MGRFLILAPLALLPALAPAGWLGQDPPAHDAWLAPPVIHSTDLFRPHDDPDDHWDLACLYALHLEQRIDLRLILANAPKPSDPSRSPDAIAVAQMNRITGAAVPLAVGSSVPMAGPGDSQESAPARDRHGIDRLLDALRTAERPVIITLTGSCRDVAVAAARAPSLFSQKVRAVYANAGTGSPDPERARRLEFNARWDKAAYQALFTLPCPLYWLPCFENDEGPLDRRPVSRHGTHFRFVQSAILPVLSNPVRRFFAHMFAAVQDPDWLGYLERADVAALLEEQGRTTRHMWCTAGLLHLAGYGVGLDGALVPGRPAAPLFGFTPIRVACADALTRWKPDPASTDRFIFTVNDLERYERAMTLAMKTLLAALP